MAGKRYQAEPDDDFRKSLWDRGHFSPLQVFRLAAWKSAMGLASLTLNSEDAIVDTTRVAMTALADWRRVDAFSGEVDWTAWYETAATAIGSKTDRTGLLSLEGFGYPMASAFLSFLAPSAFPVIDRWTVDAVYGAPVAARPKLWHRSSVYAHFAEQLVTRREDFPNAMNIHRLDQAVMSKAMSCNHADRPCDCFPTWPVEVP
jgi:hypothetical protein